MPVSIGRLRERSLHAALKQRYARPGDQFETRVGGYVIDIVRGDPDVPLLIEVQTGSFAKIKPKLLALVDLYPVRLVHPIAHEKWIVRIDGKDGHMISRRKSPRRAGVELLFRELVSFPSLVLHPNFAIDVLLTREEDVWCDDGKGSWRRKGWSIVDHHLLDVIDQIPLETADDLRALLPAGLNDQFTSSDLALGLRIARYNAQKMAYCLRAMGVIELVGKQGNALLYRLT